MHYGRRRTRAVAFILERFNALLRPPLLPLRQKHLLPPRGRLRRGRPRGRLNHTALARAQTLKRHLPRGSGRQRTRPRRLLELNLLLLDGLGA
eukprot:4642939-Lingulodinium_polyedra.AAC.1